jgi:3',5'-cyclic AMP phosphodiesterase CpdA
MVDEPMFEADRVFLHLSDIHFGRHAGDAHDANKDIRNELEQDLRTISTTLVKGVDGIIVSGDIAFGGQKTEFDFAAGWLKHISELLKCPASAIMVTPGNHDVDRAEIPEGGEVDLLHQDIRKPASVAGCDSAMTDILRDEDKGPKLVRSITAYNAFAATYECVVSPDRPYWEKSFLLGNGGELLIRGMTSTFISGPGDNETTHKMLYGEGQRTLVRKKNLFRVVVGHHPPSWTIEGDVADRAFSDRAVLQLFGHKHDHWLQRAGKGLRIIAGAVHPAHNEFNWETRYSLIALRLDADGRLRIRIFPRAWTREETMFMAHVNSKMQYYRDHVVEP